MAKKISIAIDVASEEVTFATDEVLTLTQKIKLLKKELQTVPESTAEWQVLNKAFNDNKDALDRVNTKSKELFGTISLLPGPLGNIANSVDNAINSFKIFSSIKTTDLKAGLKGVADDFGDMLSTLGKLTGITRVYTILNNALASSFVKVGIGEQAAAAGAKVFSAALISTGIGALVVGLGLAIEALYRFATASNDAAEKQKELNKQIADGAKAGADASIKFLNQEEEIDIARAKNAGKTEDEIFQIRQDYANRRINALKKLADDTLNIDADAHNKAVDGVYDEEQKKLLIQEEARAAKIKKDTEANQKQAEANKARLAQNKADEIAAQKDRESRDNAAFKVQKDAYVATLTERNAELYKVDEDYEEQRKTLIRAGITDFAAIEEQKRLAILAVNKKYDDKATEDKKKLDDDAYQKQLDDLDANVQLLEAQGQRLTEGSQAYFDNSIALENAAYERKLLGAKDNATAIEAINLEHANNLKNIDEQIRLNKLQNLVKTFEITEQFGQLISQLAGKNKTLAIAGIVVEKAATVAKIIAQMSAVPAILPPGIPNPAFIPAQIGGALAIASTVAAAAKSISEINATAGPKGSTVGASGAPSIGTYGGGGNIQAPTMGRTQSQTGALAGIVGGAIERNNSQDRPIRAYVVGNDISTQQQLDRRVRAAARLG
jgi:hypothetical protein